MAQKHVYNNVYWYLNDVTARVVAESGIPTDRYHIGKMVLQSLKDDPEFVAQIDGATDEIENNGSLLKRTVQCAISLRQMGIKHGDVMVIMAPNHLDLAVPIHAAMYLGIVLAFVDRTLKVGELELTFNSYKPSLIFCQSEKTPEIKTALEKQNLEANIYTFDQSSHGSSLADLLQADEEEVNNFKVEDFNAEDSIAIILPTSGSTGISKGAAFTYKTLTITGPYFWARFTKFPSPTRSWLMLSPAQWLTAALHFTVASYLKYTRIQTSKPVTEEHTRYLIETYRPTSGALSVSLVRHLLNPSEGGPCDMTCFDLILMAGSAVDKKVLDLIETVSPKTTVVNGYGLTELSMLVFQGHCPPVSCGRPTGLFQHRLIHLESQEDIEEPYVNGELWVKGPMFKEYINNKEATAEAFAEDGWFKTGDIFYRDDHWNFYFVERIKMLLKYRSYQIAPTEIEGVIREHPAVLDAAVTSVPDPDAGDLPVAFVIPKPGFTPTAQEIKDLVKEKLSDAKQLRGGVAFVSALPLTSTSKINRVKLRAMALEIKLE